MLSQFILRQALPFQATVGPLHERRSLSANARLWKLHSLAAEHVGCSPADMHEDMLAEHFGYTEVSLPSGAYKRIPLKRSSTRDKKEFRDFVEFVEEFYGSNLGVWLPNIIG